MVKWSGRRQHKPMRESLGTVYLTGKFVSVTFSPLFVLVAAQTINFYILGPVI